jgi:hypothetical protein
MEISKSKGQNMIKIVGAITLILLTGGAWLYLDYLNKQELATIEQMRKSMKQVHPLPITHTRMSLMLRRYLRPASQVPMSDVC